MTVMMIVTRGLLVGFLAVAWGVGPVSGHTQVGAATNTPTASDYSIVQRSANSRLWPMANIQTNASGIVTTNLQSYTELAAGLYYLSVGQYVDSVEEVDSVTWGAQAVQGRHKVQWALRHLPAMIPGTFTGNEEEMLKC